MRDGGRGMGDADICVGTGLGLSGARRRTPIRDGG